MSRKKTQIFSHPFDPWDGEDRVQLKRAYAFYSRVGKPTFPTFSDPYDGIKLNLKKNFNSSLEFIGKIPVESWLRPTPNFEDLPLLTAENFAIFIDSNGCIEYSETVEAFIESKVDGLPVMIGVDHSATGGALKAALKKYGKDLVSFIVIDSHSDFIPMKNRYDMIQYNQENSQIYSSKSNYYPFAVERPESYNAGTFIYDLIKDKSIPPDRVVIIGVSDKPQENLKYVDKRPDDAIKFYRNIEESGLKIITKQELQKLGHEEIFELFKESLNTPYVYISIDIDIGAIASIMGARQITDPPIIGLSKNELYILLDSLKRFITGEVELVGLDLMEIDVYKAEMSLSRGGFDETYSIAAHLIDVMLS